MYIGVYIYIYIYILYNKDIIDVHEFSSKRLSVLKSGKVHIFHLTSEYNKEGCRLICRYGLTVNKLSTLRQIYNIL